MNYQKTRGLNGLSTVTMEPPRPAAILEPTEKQMTRRAAIMDQRARKETK